MAETKSEKEVRLEKLATLKKLGISPYPSKTPAHIVIAEARRKKEGEGVATVGRLTGFRGHGKATFADLEDPNDRLQLFFKSDEIGDKYYELLKLFDTGDYVWVSGEMFVTKAGEQSLKVKEFQLLAKSLLPIPEGWHTLEDVETRYRQRALDFKINKEARELIKKRSQIIAGVRYFLDRHGFIEIQTPVLQPLYGGGIAKPFTTHYNVLDADFYLRISDELYLKRLVAGGFERVYEIGPDFRNEGISHMHYPEFTMCEFYWAYQSYEGLMKITQELVQELVKKIHGTLKITYQKQPIDFGGNYEVKKYADIIKDETGIDIEQAKDFKSLSAAVDKAGIKFEGQKIKVWSELVDELFKKVCRPKIFQPIFVTDYPLVTVPLAKESEQSPNIAEKFQLIAAGGFEIVNAYSELNDPIEQEARFKDQMKMRQEGWEEAQVMDENYIEALKYGMPPTAGWGMGIDRMVMVLTDQHSIKEVIPFPTLRPKK